MAIFFFGSVPKKLAPFCSLSRLKVSLSPLLLLLLLPLSLSCFWLWSSFCHYFFAPRKRKRREDDCPKVFPRKKEEGRKIMDLGVRGDSHFSLMRHTDSVGSTGKRKGNRKFLVWDKKKKRKGEEINNVFVDLANLSKFWHKAQKIWTTFKLSKSQISIRCVLQKQFTALEKSTSSSSPPPPQKKKLNSCINFSHQNFIFHFWARKGGGRGSRQCEKKRKKRKRPQRVIYCRRGSRKKKTNQPTNSVELVFLPPEMGLREEEMDGWLVFLGVGGGSSCCCIAMLVD